LNITVTTEKPESGQIIATLTISKKDVDASVKDSYREIARKYAFQGFRRGRAPRPVIDGIVGRQAVLAEATNKLLVEAEPLMIEELDVVPITQIDYGSDPQLVEEKQDYVITATITVAPEVELVSYDAPEIRMPSEEVTDTEIERRIDQLRSYRTQWVDIDEDRGAEDGDMVVADVENVANLREYAGENRMFSLDNPNIQQEFRDGLRGMKVGEEKEIRWTRSHEHDGETHEVDLAAKVKVTALRVSVMPEITEDNVKAEYGFDTVEELKEAVKDEIAAEKRATLPQLKDDLVVEAVGERLELEEVPEAYANRVYNETASQILNSLQSQGMTLDMYMNATGTSREDFVANLQQQSDERARQSLALDAFARHLEIEVTDDDIVAEFSRSGVPDVEAEMKKFVDDGRMPAVRDALRRTKALQWLSENAVVNYVDPDEFAAEAEAADEAEASEE